MPFVLLLFKFVELVLACCVLLSLFPLCEVCVDNGAVLLEVADAFTAAEAVATFAKVAAADVPGLFVDELLTDDVDDPAKAVDCAGGA